MKRNHKITIIYKNGTKVHFKTKSFTVNKTLGQLSSLSFDTKGAQYPMFVNVDEVLGIYHGWV